MEFVASERLSVSTASPYYDALKYADNELPHVRQYLREGFIELDNNLAENAIRPFALGRRNWLDIRGMPDGAHMMRMCAELHEN